MGGQDETDWLLCRDDTERRRLFNGPWPLWLPWGRKRRIGKAWKEGGIIIQLVGLLGLYAFLVPRLILLNVRCCPVPWPLRANLLKPP